MAGFREHVSVSGFLGVIYAAGCWSIGGLRPDQALIAGGLTWIGGMLPDLDSQTGRPARELFAATSVIAPVWFMQYLLHVGADPERALLLCAIFYLAARYGGASLLGRIAVHRGMFHSIPAMLIAAELTFLGYLNPSLLVRSLMSIGVACGFISHLLLDEAYSVQWRGLLPVLNNSAGTAMKLFGRTLAPNVVAYGLLCGLTYGILVDVGVIIPRGTQVQSDPSEPTVPAPLEDAEVQPRTPARSASRLEDGAWR